MRGQSGAIRHFEHKERQLHTVIDRRNRRARKKKTEVRGLPTCTKYEVMPDGSRRWVF